MASAPRNSRACVWGQQMPEIINAVGAWQQSHYQPEQADHLSRPVAAIQAASKALAKERNPRVGIRVQPTLKDELSALKSYLSRYQRNKYGYDGIDIFTEATILSNAKRGINLWPDIIVAAEAVIELCECCHDFL